MNLTEFHHHLRTIILIFDLIGTIFSSTRIEQSRVDRKRVDYEERRKSAAEETKQQQARVQYPDQLARKRYGEQLSFTTNNSGSIVVDVWYLHGERCYRRDCQIHRIEDRSTVAGYRNVTIHIQRCDCASPENASTIKDQANGRIARRHFGTDALGAVTLCCHRHEKYAPK